MQENQLCAVTAENRAMVGFVGCDNEYLVIPPEVTLDGKCCPLSVISGKAFLRCGSLTHVVVMDGYRLIGQNAFADCSALTSVTLPETVDKIGYGAFFGCKSLREITMPKEAEEISDSAFYGCRSLGSITIPRGIHRIGNLTFGACLSLQGVSLPEGLLSIPESVVSLGRFIFVGCERLKEIYFGGTVEAWKRVRFRVQLGVKKVPVICADGVVKLL